MYCDTSKIVIERCNKETVYNIVKKKHETLPYPKSRDTNESEIITLEPINV